MDDKDLVLFLKSRLGVTKLALTNGVPLVPSLCFGLKAAQQGWQCSCQQEGDHGNCDQPNPRPAPGVAPCRPKFPEVSEEMPRRSK